MSDGPAGEYTLVSVDGHPLPYRISESDISYQNIVAGTLSLTDAGAAKFITESQRGMFGVTAPQHDTAVGTYRHANDTIVIDIPSRPTVTLKRIGDEVTLEVEQHVFVWKRGPT